MNSLYIVAQSNGTANWQFGDPIVPMTLLWLLATAVSVFWIMVLVDALGSERTGNEKFLWAMVILLLPIIGASIYFLIRWPGRRRLLVRVSRPR